jgi:hypothetical protein
MRNARGTLARDQATQECDFVTGGSNFGSTSPIYLLADLIYSSAESRLGGSLLF